MLHWHKVWIRHHRQHAGGRLEHTLEEGGNVEIAGLLEDVPEELARGGGHGRTRAAVGEHELEDIFGFSERNRVAEHLAEEQLRHVEEENALLAEQREEDEGIDVRGRRPLVSDHVVAHRRHKVFADVVMDASFLHLRVGVGGEALRVVQLGMDLVGP